MARTSKKNNHFLTNQNAGQVENNDNLWKTALYARLSVEDNGKESDSLESQIAYMKSWMLDKPQFQFRTVFTDNGFTGTNYDRPGFRRLMDSVKAGEINCIVVKDLSRLGRNYIETGNFLQKVCPMLGLRCIAINDGYDSAQSNTNSEMSMSVMNIANDIYAKDISNKVSSALQSKMERGEYIGNYAPYGYQKDPENKNHLIPDPVTAPIVKRIFEMRAEGKGIGKIAATLNEEGIWSPGRYRYESGILTNNNKKGSALLWNRHVLTDLLKNIVYTGSLAQARCRTSLSRGIPFHLTAKEEWVVAEHTHEPIIERELFDRAQQVNERRAAEQKAASGRYSHLPKAVNIYGKKLVCADCGAVIKLVRSISKKGDKAYFTFKCPTHIEHRERGCTDKSISQAELDEVVRETVFSHLKLFSNHADQLKLLQHKKEILQTEDLTSQRKNALEKIIKQTEEFYAGLYMDWKEGILTEPEYLSAKRNCEKELEGMKEELEAFRRSELECAAAKSCGHWDSLLERFPDIQKLDKGIVDEFIEEIRLFDGKRVEVRLKYMDELHRFGGR